MALEQPEYGRRVRHKRETKGLSRTELALQVKRSPGYISNIESGSDPKPAAYIQGRIALALGDQELGPDSHAGKRTPRGDPSEPPVQPPNTPKRPPSRPDHEGDKKGPKRVDDRQAVPS